MPSFEDFYGLIFLIWWMCAGVVASNGWDE